MVNALLKKVSIPVLACISLFYSNHSFAAPGVSAPGAKNTIHFVENKGQLTDQHGAVRGDIDYKMNGGDGVNIFVAGGHMHYQWMKTSYSGIDNTKVLNEAYRLDIILEGAKTNVRPIAEDKADYHERYYTPGMDGTDVASYRKITYRNIYNNIDWVLYAKDGKLKYDFIIHEGGKAEDIRIRYEGATSAQIENGDIRVITPFGEIREKAPYTYHANTKQPIASAYKLSGNILTFSVAENNGPIVIDPSLEWGTYKGYTSEDIGYSVVVDTAQNSYMGGYTASSSNFIISGAHQASFGGNIDGFITKYTPAGIPVWCTYYGGSGDDIINSLRINKMQELIFCGVTASPNTANVIATGSAHQSSHGGGTYDAFFGKLEIAAGARQWASYYGGTGDERMGIHFHSCITTDEADNIYLAGTTSSDGGIGTSGTAQSTRNSQNDGFIAKFNTGGARQWGTYFGGTYNERFTGIAVTAKNMVYVVGESNSDSLGTAGVHARYRVSGQASGMTDLLIGKFNGADGGLLWATYYGGEDDDISRDIVLKDTTGVFLSASTNSSSGIVSSTPHQSVKGQNFDMVLASFDSLGSRKWGTYLGAGGTDHGGKLLVDPLGNLYFVGTTASNSDMATQGSVRTSLNMGTNDQLVFDAVFGAFTPTGSRIWSSYYGGTSNDYGFGIAMTKQAHLYICGNTTSTADVAYSGSQISLGGGNDAFLVKFTPDTSVFIFQPFNQLTHCVEDSFTLKYGVTSAFNNSNVFTVQLSNNAGSFASPTNIGVYSSGIDGNIRCGMPVSQTGTGFRIRIIGTAPIDTSYDNGLNITIKPRPVKPTASSNSAVCSNDTLKLYGTTSTSGVTWGWTGPSYSASTQNPTRTVMTSAHSGQYIVTATLSGCSRSDTTNVTIKQAAPKPDVTTNSPICSGNTLQFTTTNYSGTGSDITWSGPAGFSANGVQNPQRVNAQTSHSGDYIIYVLQNTCYSKDTVSVTVNQTPNPITATSNSPVCTAETLSLYGTTSTSGLSYSWTGPSGFTASTANASRTNLSTTFSGDYIVRAYSGSCDVKDTVTVTILPSPPAPDATASTPLCSGTNLHMEGANLAGNVPSWTGPNFNSTGKPLDTLYNVQVADAGDYILTSTATNGCKTHDTVRVSVSQSAQLSFTASIDQGSIVCPTSNVTFKVSPAQPIGATYAWTGPGATLTNANTATPSKNNVQYADSGYYVLRIFTSACSAGIDSVKLRVVDTISKPVLTSNSAVCESVDTLRLEANHIVPGVQFTWIGPDGIPIIGKKITTPNVPFTDSGWYVVTAELNGCKAKDSIHVVVKPTPLKPTGGSNAPVCENKAINFTSNSLTPGVTYQWQGPASFNTTLQNPSIPVATSTNAGMYIVQALLNGCYSVNEQVMVVVNPNPKPDIEWNSPVCEGTELVLTTAQITDESYAWSSSVNPGFTGAGTSAVISETKLSDIGTYKVVAKNNVTGCEGSDEQDIEIIPMPGMPDAIYQQPLCEGKQLELSVKDTSTFVSYLWKGPNNYLATSKNAIRNDVQLGDSGYYKITVTRDPGCTRTDSVLVVVRPTPPVPLLSSNSPIVAGSDLQLQMDNPMAGLGYKWTGPDGFGSLVQNPVVYNAGMASAGVYYLLVNLNGCLNSNKIEIAVNPAEAEREELILFPSPNNGNFTVKALLYHDQVMTYEVLNSVGMILHRDTLQSQNKAFELKLSIDGKLASGFYIFRIMMSGQSKEIPFSVVR